MTARVLVVEDEFFIAREIADALEEAGYAVLGPCPSVAAALAMLDGDTPSDAAVLDVSLRDATSLPVAEALARRGIPYAVVTGFGMSQLPAAMAQAPLLTKPLDPADLVVVMGRLLSRP